MTFNETTVHGSIFYLLKKFVISQFSEIIWKQFLKESGKEENYEFIITESYNIKEIEAILQAASKYSGHSIPDLQQSFGEWLVPDLFQFYGDYLRPEWKTWDVLVNTEKVMHGAVRRLNSTANPPVLHVSEVIGNKLIIDYHSKRRMGSLAVGIIKGIAKYYGEDDKVEVVSISSPDAERVQVQVIFSNR